MAGRSSRRRLGVRNTGSGQKQESKGHEEDKSDTQADARGKTAESGTSGKATRKRTRDSSNGQRISGKSSECISNAKKVYTSTPLKEQEGTNGDQMKHSKISSTASKNSKKNPDDSIDTGISSESGKIGEKRKEMTSSAFDGNEVQDQDVCTCQELGNASTPVYKSNMDRTQKVADSSEYVTTDVFYGKHRGIGEGRQSAGKEGKSVHSTACTEKELGYAGTYVIDSAANSFGLPDLSSDLKDSREISGKYVQNILAEDDDNCLDSRLYKSVPTYSGFSKGTSVNIFKRNSSQTTQVQTNNKGQKDSPKSSQPKRTIYTKTARQALERYFFIFVKLS